MSDNGQLHQRKAIFGKVPQELMHDLTITDGAVRLYAHMHWRYGRNRQMFEKLETIAKWLGISERAVRDRILELEARDWIVVISRRNPASHTARVNKYHVFEDRQDAIDFRANPFDLGELDSVRPKSEVDVRKSRAGLGGIPSHKAKTTGTQVPMDNRNSSSNGEGDDNRNSSSKELEALKALNQTHSVATVVTTDSPSDDADYTNWVNGINTPKPQVARPKGAKPHPSNADVLLGAIEVEATDFDLLVLAVQRVLNIHGGGAEVYAKMLDGQKGRGEYNTYRMDEPVSATELQDWANWYDGAKVDDETGKPLRRPTIPMKLQSSLIEWRNLGKPTTGGATFDYGATFEFEAG